VGWHVVALTDANNILLYKSSKVPALFSATYMSFTDDLQSSPIEVDSLFENDRQSRIQVLSLHNAAR
jgi:hypothetical protein